MAQLTWDPAGDGSTSGGSGNWTLGPWYNGAADGPWIPANDALLQGTGGTVSLTAPVLVNNLTFAVDGYTIVGNSTLSFNSGATNITDGSGNYFGPTIVNNGGNATISVPITTSNATELNFASSGTTTLTAASTLAGGSRFYLYSGNLVISGTGSVTSNGSWNDIGAGTNSSVSMTLQNSAGFFTDNDFRMGDTPSFITGNTITVTVQDNATLNANNIYAGRGANNTAIMNVSGNATVAVNNEFDLGDATNGTLTQTGGTITVAGALYVGNNGGGSGVYNVSAGQLTTQDSITVGRAGASGVVNQTGGTVSEQGADNIIIGSLSGSGAWNLSGGTVRNNGVLGLGENAGGVGTVRLNAGLFQATGVQTWGAGVGYLYFNGGTLQISGNGGYIGARDPGAGGVLNTFIQAGGAIIDTNGNNIVVNNPLMTDPALTTDGGLTKYGLGTLALNGTASTAANSAPSSYLGPTVVNAGTLLVTGGLTATSSIDVKSGATLGGDGPIAAVVLDSNATLAPGYTYNNALQVGLLQPAGLTTSAGGTLAFKLSGSASAGNDQIAVAGNMSIANGTVINISDLLNASLSNGTSGTYTLISAPGNTTPVGTLTVAGLPLPIRQTYNLDVTPSAVNLVVSGSAANLVWTGNAGNAWDVTATKNFLNVATQAADVFYNLDNVAFNDTGSPNNIVNIATNVSPGSVTFSMTSASSGYTLTGAGGITGASGLVVNGAGTVTIANPNTYTGETDIHGGTVVVASGGVAGDHSLVSATNIAPASGDTATVTVSGGTLFANPLSVGAAGAGALNVAGGQVTVGGPVNVATAGGIGCLIMSGSGSLTVTTNNQFVLGANGGTATMVMGDNAMVTNMSTNSDPQFIVGNGGGLATLTQSGNSTINTGGGEFWVGQGTGGIGTFNMSGGSTNVGNWFVIGRQGATGAANISGNASVTISNGPLSIGDSGVGTLVQSGNSVINVAADNTYIGTSNGAAGAYALQGGTINTGDIRTGVSGAGEFDLSGGVANVRGWFRVGEFVGSTGTVNITGGALNIGTNADGSNNSGMRLNVGEGSTGAMNITGGQVTVNGPVTIGGQSWDGQASGAGYVTMSGNSTLTVTTRDAFMVGFSGGAGTMDISGGTVTTGGDMHVGDGNGQTGSNGAVYQSGNAVVNVQNTGGGYNNLLLGVNSQGTGIGTYNLSGGSVSAGDIRAGVDGAGRFTQTGGLANLNGSLRLAEMQGSTGVYNLSAGTVNVNLMARIGEEGSGTMNISGNGVMQVVQDVVLGLPIDNNTLPGRGLLNLTNNALLTVAGGFYPGNGGGTGVVNIGDNAGIQIIGGGNLDIGDSTGGAGNLPTSGTVNQSGGTISLAGGQLWIGKGGHGSGVYNMSGGLLNVNNLIAVGRSSGTGVFNMSGGTIQQQGGGNIIVGSLGGSGAWNMNGGMVFNNSNLVLGENGNSGSFYLNGGTVQASGITTNNAGTGYLYFNGGVLQATGNNGNFLTTTNAGAAPGFNYIQSGGAVIDTSGFNIAVSAGLAPDPALSTTDGGLTKTGSGILALTGPNTYAGPTVVQGGTLLVSVNPLTTTSGIEVKPGATLGGDTAVAAVTLDAGATLAPGYTFANPSQIGVLQPASLTSSGGTLAFKITPAGNDEIQVAGNLNLTNVTIDVSNLLNGPIPAGTYNLITSGGTSDLGLTLAGLPLSRQTYQLDYSTPGTVALDVSPGVAANLVWTGGANNTWDVATTKNWYNTGAQAADLFFNLDNVAFNDTGIANNTVNIPANVMPGSVTVNLSSSSAFTLTGAGGITGTTGLVMSGAGTLTVSTPNAYTGETDLHGGTVVITASGALGDRSGTSATNIAPAAGDAATVIVNGGTLGGLALSVGGSGAGALNVTSGIVNVGTGGVSLGGASGGIGYLNMSGNALLTVAGTNNPTFVVGGNGGTGVMTLGGSATVNNSSTGGDPVFVVGNNSSGTLTQSGNAGINTAAGEFWVGQGAAGNGQYNMSGGMLAVGNWLVVGRQGATGAANVTGNATLTVTNGTLSVGDGGPGALVQSGNSLINVTTGDTYIGTNAGAIGTYALQGGTLNTGEVYAGFAGSGIFDVTGGLANLRLWLRVGGYANSSGTVNISGGAVNVGMNANGTANSGMRVNIGESGAGVLNMSGGLLTSTGHIDIGDPGNGALNQTGGTISTGDQVWVGSSTGGNGSYSMSGGVLITQSWIDVGRAHGTGVLTMTGGAINKQGGGNIIVGALGGNGTWNMDSGLVLNNSNLVLGENSSTGSFYLNGGTVQATAVTTYINPAPNNVAVGNLYFNGGVLQVANANHDNFGNYIANSGGDYIQAGGAIIDTNGNNVAIFAQLAPDPALTTKDGGLTKQGAGMLTLNAANSYSGGSVVNGGSLQLGSVNALGSGGLTVNSGAVDLAGYSPTVASLGGGTAGAITNSRASPVTLTVDQASATTFAGSLLDGASTLALTKIGAGTLVLSGSDSYTGGTTVGAGALVATTNTAIGGGTSLTVAAGGTFVFNPSLAGSPVSAGRVAAAASPEAVAAVPEPGTLVLLLAGLAVGLGICRRYFPCIY